MGFMSILTKGTTANSMAVAQGARSSMAVAQGERSSMAVAQGSTGNSRGMV